MVIGVDSQKFNTGGESRNPVAANQSRRRAAGGVRDGSDDVTGAEADWGASKIRSDAVVD